MVQVIVRILVLSAPLWLNDFYRFYLPPNADILAEVLDIIIYVAWQSSLIYMAHEAKWFQFSDMGFPIYWKKDLLWGVVLTLGVTLIYLSLSIGNHFMLELFGMQTPDSGHPPNPQWSNMGLQMHIIYISFSAGFFEEVIYRGIIIQQIEKKSKSPFVIILLSASVFMLIHWSLSYTIWILSFVLGAFWSFLFLRYRRIVPLIVSHFIFDYLSFSGLLQTFLNAFSVKGI